MSAPRSLVLIGATLLSAAVSLPVAAQSAQRLSLQASGLHVSAYGEAYEGLKAAPGAEVQLRFTPGVWSFGVGGQVSSHAFDDPTFGPDEKVMLAGFFFEPRRVIDVGSSRLAPYLSARVSVLRQSLDFVVNDGTNDFDVTAEASGTQVNGGGGVLLRLTPRVNLDLGATFGLIKFGDVKVDIPGVGSTSVDGSSGTGQNLVIRVGLAIGLGG
jgi:hypothetical protein